MRGVQSDATPGTHHVDHVVHDVAAARRVDAQLGLGCEHRHLYSAGGCVPFFLAQQKNGETVLKGLATAQKLCFFPAESHDWNDEGPVAAQVYASLKLRSILKPDFRSSRELPYHTLRTAPFHFASRATHTSPSATHDTMPPAAAQNPKDAHFERLKAVQEARGMKGSMLIVGIPRGEDDEESEEEESGEDDDEEEKDDGKVYTAEQMATLRHILVNDARDEALQKAFDFASGGQADQGFMMTNTHDGNQLIFSIPKEVKKATAAKKSLPQRFDALLALTYALKEYDFWIHDNECWEEGGELEKAIACLAKAWKTLLAKTDDELGIDGEFSRPGVEALLEQFEEAVGELEAGDYSFKWK